MRCDPLRPPPRTRASPSPTGARRWTAASRARGRTPAARSRAARAAQRKADEAAPRRRTLRRRRPALARAAVTAAAATARGTPAACRARALDCAPASRRKIPGSRASASVSYGPYTNAYGSIFDACFRSTITRDACSPPEQRQQHSWKPRATRARRGPTRNERRARRRVRRRVRSRERALVQPQHLRTQAHR